MSKTRLLYIHGLGGTKNGHTSESLRKICNDYNINFYSFDVPFNPYEALETIKTFIKENNINLLMASSLGAFYTLVSSLMLDKDINVIVINPAFYAPKDILDNFGKGKKEYRGIREDGNQYYDLNDEYYESLNEIYNSFQKYLSAEKERTSNWVGYFSDNDEYFSHKEDFSKYSKNIIDIKDKHHIGYDNLKMIIEDYIKRSN